MVEGFESVSLGGFLDALAARSPAPGGGAAAAVTVALAAGLVSMAAGYSDELPDHLAARARRQQARATALADEDASAYAGVLAARSSGDAGALRDAWRRAVEVPLEISKCGVLTAQDAVLVAECGPASEHGDAVVGAVLAEAAVRAAVRLVRINVADADEDPEYLTEASALAEEAAAAVHRLQE